MTIPNVIIRPDLAIVGVDSDAARADGKPGRRRISKMVPIAHANAVLAARGNSIFLTMLFACCNSQGGNFDEILESMPRLVDDCSRAILWHWSHLALDQSSILRQEVVLAGWSERAHRMVARSFRGDPRKNDFAAEDIEYGFAAPVTHEIEAGNWPPLETVSDMVQLASAQAARLREEAPDCAVGGNFFVAQISQRRTLISRAYDLG